MTIFHSSATRITVLLITLAGIAFSQQHGIDPVQIDAGARLYGSACSTCHGPDGDRVSGVELKKGLFRHASNEVELAAVIQKGIPGTAMPPNNIQRGDLVALVAYLRAMRDFRTRKVTLGDAAAGRVVFEEKGGCAGCHRVNGKGSYRSVDLSDIGAVRTGAFLEDALLDPSKIDFPQNRFVRAVTKEGVAVTGRRLNEDTLTIQIISSDERLMTLIKADLKEFSVEKGPGMPAYRDSLSASERADLLAYLVALTGVVPAAGNGAGGARQ